MPFSFLPVHVSLTLNHCLCTPLYPDQTQQGKSVWNPGQWNSTYYVSALDTASVPSKMMSHTVGIHMAVFNNCPENISNPHKTLILGFLPGRHKGQLWNPDVLNWSSFKMISRKEIPERRCQGYPVNGICMALWLKQELGFAETW